MIKELLPLSLQNDENIRALAEVFEKGYEEIQKHIINVLIYSRIDELPEEILDLLAWQFHIEGYELAETVEEKRNFVRNAIELHRHKGTPYAIKKVLEALGLEGRIQEWFEYGGEAYRFKVEVNSTTKQITAELRDTLIKLINKYKNVRSWLEEIALTYLSRGAVYISAGCMAETEAYAEMIEGYEWSAAGSTFIYAGAIGEVEAWAM